MGTFSITTSDLGFRYAFRLHLFLIQQYLSAPHVTGQLLVVVYEMDVHAFCKYT